MIAQLSQTIGYLENQNEKYTNENKALREAQVEMEDRHTAEVIELKKLKLKQVNLNEGFEDGADER